MATILFANDATSALYEPLAAADVLVYLTPGTGGLFPSPGAGQYFVLTLSDQATSTVQEVMWCTDRTVDTLTVTRAQEATPAVDWPAGTPAQNLLTAGQMNALAQSANLPPPTPGTGGGAAQHLYSTTDTVALTALTSLVVGSSYEYLNASDLDLQGSRGQVDVLDATGALITPVDGTWLFDTLLLRSYIVGAVSSATGLRFRLFKNLQHKETLSSWGLNTNSGSGQDAVINAAVQGVRNAYVGDLFATSLGPPITGKGIYFPTDTIDAYNANWDTPQLTIMSPTTFPSIKPVLRFGRPGTGPNTRLDNPQSIRATVKGINTSTALNLSNAIGVQLYDLASPVCEVDVNCSRLYTALDVATNSEKLNIRIGSAYNWRMLSYTPVQVSAAYTGSLSSKPVSSDLWPYLANRGSWNPTSNTPTLLTGQAYLYKGWYWKASASATLSVPLDGITSVITGDLIFSDGVVFDKRKTVNFSPDTNHIELNGEVNAQFAYIPDAADCSLIFAMYVENRFDPGPAYDIVNFQGATIPFPGIYDGNGKETVFVRDSWWRAGDSRLGYYGNKDNGLDTTLLGFDTDHAKGTIVRIDRGLRVHFGGVYKDCQDGTYFGNLGVPIPCPVVQLGSIGWVGGEIQIIQALNREGILGGDPTLGLIMQNLRVAASVQMGTQTGPTDITSSRNYVAFRGQGVQNTMMEFRSTQGQIVLPDVCITDGTTPSNIHGLTCLVDPVFCSAQGAYTQGGSVDAQLLVRGAMSFAEARAAVSNWTGVTNARFEDITDRQGGMTWDGTTWYLG